MGCPLDDNDNEPVSRAQARREAWLRDDQPEPDIADAIRRFFDVDPDTLTDLGWF